MASRVFPQLGSSHVCESYLGFKTEIVMGAGERNYQYILREVEEGLFAAVPGKFSLAFSLAANTFRRLTGEEPRTTIRLAGADAAAPFVGLTQHAQIVRDRPQ
jgi:hypothetical protein